MSAGDILITIITWLLKNTILLLPTDIAIFPLATLTGYLDSFKVNIVYALSGLAKLFPVDLLLVVASVVLAGEILLFGVKAGIFVANLIRGSGA